MMSPMTSTSRPLLLCHWLVVVLLVLPLLVAGDVLNNNRALGTAEGLTDVDDDGPPCVGPAIELTVGVGCDFSGFFTEALGLHSALTAARFCVRTPMLSRWQGPTLVHFLSSTKPY